MLLEISYYGMNQSDQVQFLIFCFRSFEVVGLLHVNKVRGHFSQIYNFEGLNNSYSIARARLFVGEGRVIRFTSCLVNIVLVCQRTKSISRYLV